MCVCVCVCVFKQVVEKKNIFKRNEIFIRLGQVAHGIGDLQFDPTWMIPLSRRLKSIRLNADMQSESSSIGRATLGENNKLCTNPIED